MAALCGGGRRRDLPRNPPHVDDATGRDAPPAEEHLILPEADLHPRPDAGNGLLVATLQNLLGLRVSVLNGYHEILLSNQRGNTIPSYVAISPIVCVYRRYKFYLYLLASQHAGCASLLKADDRREAAC